MSVSTWSVWRRASWSLWVVACDLWLFVKSAWNWTEEFLIGDFARHPGTPSKPNVQEDLSCAYYHRLEETFSFYASNKQYLTKIELLKCLRSLDHYLTTIELNRFMIQADLDENEVVDLDEFITLMGSMMGGWEPEEDIALCWRSLDPCGRGTIPLATLRKLLSKFGAKMNNEELNEMFDEGGSSGTPSSGDDDSSPREDDLIPVPPARFQILHVPTRCSIKEFVSDNSLIFSTGRGFYEFTKPEKISDKKEVVLVDRTTGDMFTGPEACEMIGAGGGGRIKPTALDNWRVFVQSTSYNRVLMPDTGFLYEVDTDH